MKCPKCHYLGFETGDRCRHCGYDFSLVSVSAAADPPLGPLPAAPADPLGALPLDTIVAAPRAAAGSATAATSRVAGRAAPLSLPLFPQTAGDDEPLITLPVAPRPPLAVRRTPDRPRRSTPRPVRRQAEPAPAPPAGDAQLHLADVGPAAFDDFRPAAIDDVRPAHVRPAHRAADRPAAVPLTVIGTGRRLSAALCDHALLVAVDLIVVYFTIKMAGLTLADWHLVPPVPLASFLLLLKVAYFATFTLVGGQTIGKMALRIRVVGDDGSPLDAARAVQRTVVGAVSMLPAGAGLLPLLVGPDRLGVHDRVARTRVVAVPSSRGLA